MYVTDGLLFQAMVSCRVRNSSPLRFHLNSSPREAAYERISEVTTSGRTVSSSENDTHSRLSQNTTKLIH